MRSDAGFPVLGRAFRPRTRSRPLQAWLHDRWDRPEHAGAPHPFRIDLEETATPPAQLAGAHADARLLGFTVPFVIGRDAAEYRNRDGGGGVRVELGDDGAAVRVWGVPPPGGSGSDRFWAALDVALHEAFRASGLLPFHAAVLAREGRAFALAGPSGAGKSTTLLLTARGGGWAILAEDLSWLDPDTLALHGWDAGLRLWPETIDRFAPDLADLPWRTDERGKRFVPWNALDVPLQRAARLHGILSLTGDAAAGARPVRQAEALKMLWQSTGVPLLPSVRDRVARTLASLLDRLRFDRQALGEPFDPCL